MATYRSRFLASLFESPTFPADVMRVAALPKETLDAVATTLASPHAAQPTELYSRAEIQGIAERTQASASDVQLAFYLSAFLGGQLASNRVTSEDLVADTSSLLQERQVASPAFIDHLRRLTELREVFQAQRERKRLLEDGGRTLERVTFVCDLRARTTGETPYDYEQLAAYHPQLVELVPVVTVKLVPEDAGEGEEFIVQLTSFELKNLITSLQAAEKQLQAVAAAVTIRAPQERNEHG